MPISMDKTYIKACMFIGRKIIAAPQNRQRRPPAEKKAFNRSPLHLSSYKQIAIKIVYA